MDEDGDEGESFSWNFDDDIKKTRTRIEKEIEKRRQEEEKTRKKNRKEVKTQIIKMRNDKLETLKTKLFREIEKALEDGENSLTYPVSGTESNSWCFEAHSGEESEKTTSDDFVRLLSYKLERYNFRVDSIKNGFYDKRKNKFCNGFIIRADGNCKNCGFTESVHTLNTIKSFTISWN